MNKNSYLVAVYGLIILIGGLIGFLKAQSLPSLIAGLSFAILLLFCAWGIKKNYLLGYIGSVVTSGLLAVFFGFRFYNSGSFMPAGLMVILSVVVFVWLLVKRK